jgi:hypothetical protein
MSTLTAKQRRALPLSDFGDPERRLFPIVDQADVESASHLIGKAKDPAAVRKRIISIAKRKGLTIPDAWKETASMAALSAVALADASSTVEADGMVRRTALITTVGTFPDHDWAITPDELKASADAFADGPGRGYVEIEHIKSHGTASILDGHTGYVDGVWTSEDGAELWGDLVLPPWLNAIADANGGKVSAVFDKEAKGFVGVGLVLEPAVPEAAMLSAFVDFAKRHDTPRGQYAVQDLHDSAVRHGAVCTAGNATMASKHEAGAIQQIHDLAVDHGAKCDAVGKSGGQMMMYSKAEQTEQAEQEEGQTVPDEQKNTDGKSQEPTVAALQAQLAAEKTQRDADRKALVALQAERRQEKANAFVDALITENKVLPAQRDTLVALHLAAATSDDTRGLVTLADGKEQSLLQSVITALSSFQSLGLTREQLTANPDVAILLNRQKTQEQEDKDTGTPEDNEKLLAMTPLGQKALERKRRAAAGH